MTTPNTNPRVDAFIKNTEQWQEEFKTLRAILLGCNLAEDLKWGKPCYTFENNNVVLMHGFKEYCALLFIKGALMHDPQGILVQQTKNVQAGRQIRFTSVQEIAAMQSVLEDYVRKAIEVEKSGLEVEFKKSAEYAIPVEFQNKLNEIPELKTAFETLTPGRQRGYLLYLSEPKQAKTRESRVEKCMPQILSGKGLNE